MRIADGHEDSIFMLCASSHPDERRACVFPTRVRIDLSHIDVQYLPLVCGKKIWRMPCRYSVFEGKVGYC